MSEIEQVKDKLKQEEESKKKSDQKIWQKKIKQGLYTLLTTNTKDNEVSKNDLGQISAENDSKVLPQNLTKYTEHKKLEVDK